MMSSILKNDSKTLARINAIPRDTNIEFTEYGHKYTINTDKNGKYTSVTTWCHSHFPKFDADEVIKCMMSGKNWNPENKYWNMTPVQIKTEWNQNGANAAKAGTSMHNCIERFMNQPKQIQFLRETIVHKMVTRSRSKSPPQATQATQAIEPPRVAATHEELLCNYLAREFELLEETGGEEQLQKINASNEWTYFLKFVTDYPRLKPYRTEWMIYDEELKLAGSIDMVYENSDGTLSIYDWKRVKEIAKTNSFNKHALTECINYVPDTNFWHYSLQLNTYKGILERNYNKIVKELFLVRLYPEASGYELVKVPIMTEMMGQLFELRIQQQQQQEQH